jgi:2-iminobutanoate/2-iminopropanoate deaminase
MPNPKPARATVKVAGLIGDAKIEISAIAVKQQELSRRAASTGTE